MNKQREALQLALEALEANDTCDDSCQCSRKAALKAVRKALAEPEQEPLTDGELYAAFLIGLNSKKPARKPLTDDEIDKIIASNVTITDRNLYGAMYMAIREVEQAHGIGG